MKLQWVNVVHVTYSDTFILKPACYSDTVYRIDHNMPSGEYFLVEYRRDCGFDVELRNPSGDPGRERYGAALWHVDETGKLSGISYTSEGVPGDGQYPKKHYKVALAQADGDWDLESGRNRGDETDLFIRADNPWKANTAYKIGPQGLVLNNGQTKPGVNTNSYATGQEKYTGITIEFGQAGSTMEMKVTLDGAPKPQAISPTPPPPTPTAQPPTPAAQPNPQPTPSIAREGIPQECRGKKGRRVCFSGVGMRPDKMYAKKCYFVKMVKETVCNEPDNVETGKIGETSLSKGLQRSSTSLE